MKYADYEVEGKHIAEPGRVLRKGRRAGGAMGPAQRGDHLPRSCGRGMDWAVQYLIDVLPFVVQLHKLNHAERKQLQNRATKLAHTIDEW